jgi:hypothetical protein
MMRLAVLFFIMRALVCSAPALTLKPDEEAAQQAALEWLKVLDSGNYSDAAQMMAEEVRGQQDWPSFSTRVGRRWAACKVDRSRMCTTLRQFPALEMFETT